MKFSDDLVYVSFADAKPRAVNFTFRGKADLALWSRAGESLKLDIVPGLIPGVFRDRPDTVYKLKDSQEKVLAEGTMKLEPTKHTLTLAVPRGLRLYFLDFNDSGDGWRIEVGAGKVVTLLTRRDHPFLHTPTMQETFFYVPKGTKALHYFCGGPHKVLGPDQKVVRDIQVSDDIVSVAVPPAFAGKVWSLSAQAHRHLWFFNAPNCLAASPGGLMLPIELAKKDKLVPTK